MTDTNTMTPEQEERLERLEAQAARLAEKLDEIIRLLDEQEEGR